MLNRLRLNQIVITLSVIALSACSGTLELPNLNTQVDVASPNTTPPTSDEATEPKANESIPQDCGASQPGKITGFDEFLPATLQGDKNQKLYISTAPGAQPGASYGVAGDEVEAMAIAFDNDCTAWTWLKWPESNYRGWLPSAVVELTQ